MEVLLDLSQHRSPVLGRALALHAELLHEKADDRWN
jgi:hypothetical protein